MPLIATNRPIILIEGERWSVGMWMQVANPTPAGFVWVVATYECVEDLDHPNELADQQNAIAIAESNRALLEKAASTKFDREGTNPNDGMQDKKPVLKLHSYDLPS
jgi:hypothetical protein